MRAGVFECYRHSPTAHLDDEERAVLRVLKEARGFYVSRGLSLGDVLNRLKWSSAEKAAKVQEIEESLIRLGLAKRLSNGNVRRM